MSTVSSSHCVTWDVETAPLPDSYLDLICPKFDPPANYKDEEKIAQNIAEQKEKWKERAALSPMTGKVLCIGLRDIDGSFRVLDGGGNEAALLIEWCDLVARYKHETFIGFNTHVFDIPFLTKRCWRHAIKPFLRPGVKLYNLDNWIDLRLVWQMGDRQSEGSLDSIAKHLGVGAKNGEGKDFHRLWETDRAAALTYLENDITLTHAIGGRLGVVL